MNRNLRTPLYMQRQSIKLAGIGPDRTRGGSAPPRVPQKVPHNRKE